MSRHNLRRKDRRSCTEPVGIMWRDSAGEDKFMNAPLEDISETGAGLQILGPVQVRSFVTLYADKLGLHGRASVRHCSRQGMKYRIGVEFTGGMRWKPVEAEEEVAAPS